MQGFMERFAEHGTLLGDGAMGTMLLERGLVLGACPELWNVEREADVRAVAEAYLDAGADVLETNSFGGSTVKLEDFGLGARCAELNRAAARIAREVAGDRAFVLGSMGPTGKLMAPLGSLDEQTAHDGFARQAEALAEGGADALVVETMIALEEAVIAVKAAATTGLPVLATMTFELGRRGFFTVMGVTVERAARGLADAGADAVGANCGFGPAEMLQVAQVFRGATDLPLVFQTNAGLPELIDGEATYPAGPPIMAALTRDLSAISGVLLIGGCCGTNPAHISAMRSALGAQAAP